VLSDLPSYIVAALNGSQQTRAGLVPHGPAAPLAAIRAVVFNSVALRTAQLGHDAMCKQAAAHAFDHTVGQHGDRIRSLALVAIEPLYFYQHCQSFANYKTSKWRNILIRDACWSEHLGCWSQNTSRIQIL
jgi:hypothetical protein